MGYQSLAGVCIADRLVPRQIAPLSLGDVTLRRPTLRWELPAEFDGALVELCRDRACAQVIETINVVGTSARPLMPLPATTVVFWRLRGTAGARTSAATSATWLIHAPAMDNSGAIDSSQHAHLDVNADGFDDVVVGAPQASPGGRTGAGTATIFLGGASGISTTPARVLEGVAVDDHFGFDAENAGDVNGDGFGDVIVGANAADPNRRLDSGSAYVYYGSLGGVVPTGPAVLDGVANNDAFGQAVASAGDVNGGVSRRRTQEVV